MDDAVADIYREIALKTTKNACVDLGDVCIFHLPEMGSQQFTIRGADRKLLSQGDDMASCILAARAKLQAERDAKDAPKLREERDKLVATLKELVEACKDETWHNKNFRKWSDAKQLLKEVAP